MHVVEFPVFGSLLNVPEAVRFDVVILRLIHDVESVTFATDAHPMEWKDEGLEVERLKAELEKEKRENHIMCEHFGFIREWFFIYQEAFDKIHDDCKRAERENQGIYVNPAAIIEQAEMKYAESQKRFEKVREKWDKKEK